MHNLAARVHIEVVASCLGVEAGNSSGGYLKLHTGEDVFQRGQSAAWIAELKKHIEHNLVHYPRTPCVGNQMTLRLEAKPGCYQQLEDGLIEADAKGWDVKTIFKRLSKYISQAYWLDGAHRWCAISLLSGENFANAIVDLKIIVCSNSEALTEFYKMNHVKTMAASVIDLNLAEQLNRAQLNLTSKKEVIGAVSAVGAIEFSDQAGPYLNRIAFPTHPCSDQAITFHKIVSGFRELASRVVREQGISNHTTLAAGAKMYGVYAGNVMRAVEYLLGSKYFDKSIAFQPKSESSTVILGYNHGILFEILFKGAVLPLSTKYRTPIEIATVLEKPLGEFFNVFLQNDQKFEEGFWHMSGGSSAGDYVKILRMMVEDSMKV